MRAVPPLREERFQFTKADVFASARPFGDGSDHPAHVTHAAWGKSSNDLERRPYPRSSCHIRRWRHRHSGFMVARDQAVADGSWRTCLRFLVRAGRARRNVRRHDAIVGSDSLSEELDRLALPRSGRGARCAGTASDRSCQCRCSHFQPLSSPSDRHIESQCTVNADSSGSRRRSASAGRRQAQLGRKNRRSGQPLFDSFAIFRSHGLVRLDWIAARRPADIRKLSGRRVESVGAWRSAESCVRRGSNTGI